MAEQQQQPNFTVVINDDDHVVLGRDPAYANVVTVNSNGIEMRVKFGLTPFDCPPKGTQVGAEISVAKIGEIILPPAVALSMAELILQQLRIIGFPGPGGQK